MGRKPYNITKLYFCHGGWDELAGKRIQILQRDKLSGEWEPINLSKVRLDQTDIIIGGTIRILVNGKVVYENV